MRIIRQLFISLALFFLLLSFEKGYALDVGLELSPGVGFPMTNFVKGYPVPFDDPDYGTGRLLADFYHKASFQLALTVMLNNFEIRYNFMLYGWKKVTFTHIAFDQYNTNLLIPLEGTGVQQSYPLPSLAKLYFHTITFGYRFYLLDDVIRPYIPIGGGFALAHSDVFDAVLPGMSLYIGLGVLFKITHWISAGIDIRYVFVGVRNPKTVNSNMEQALVDTTMTGGGALSVVISGLHMVTMTANVLFRF